MTTQSIARIARVLCDGQRDGDLNTVIGLIGHHVPERDRWVASELESHFSGETINQDDLFDFLYARLS
jgi:hypothetical protein